jgi:hypothetical protein
VLGYQLPGKALTVKTSIATDMDDFALVLERADRR